MKILVINGSPRGKASNSLRLANSFVGGVRHALEAKGIEVVVDTIDVSKLSIGPCKGCFGCWKTTPGTCVIKDDMATVLQKRIAADLIVWSFPLYFFNVPGPLKNLIDRQLPMVLPFMSERADGYGSGSHETRYDLSGIRNVLVSTCGFHSAAGNYDSVRSMFDHFLGKGAYTEILCGQGELFSKKELSDRTDAYLATARQAGIEYIDGGITDETSKKLREPLYPKDVFEAMADASWGVSKETGEKTSEDLVFTKQMAALYNPASYDGHDRVLEMRYTDTGNTYQLLLGKQECTVITDVSLSPTTTIETTFELWLAIARGEIGGSEALGQGKYLVTGDFQMMIDWDTYFGAGKQDASGESDEAQDTQSSTRHGSTKPPSMVTMLIPWIAFWIAVSIDPTVGSVVALAVTMLAPMLMSGVLGHQLVRWDWLSCLAVTALSLLAYFTGAGTTVTTVGYLVFGLMWLLSCHDSEDLCVTYVKYGYGGDKALRNPLFMKTCHVLTLAWGVLYVATAAWTYVLRQAGVGDIIVIANNLVPIAMGIFTKWFQGWYPAHLARG